jgi:hypothetical protein
MMREATSYQFFVAVTPGTETVLAGFFVHHLFKFIPKMAI